MQALIARYRLILFVIIPLTSVIMHFRVFNKELVGMHVWRQTQTQTNIRNFYEEDHSILNPHVNWRDASNPDGLYRMEFPLMQWLFAKVYQLFGDHIIISRILTFIIGLCTVWGMFWFLLAVSGDKRIALIGAWAFNFSPVFYYYTVNPLPDNLALCMSVWFLAFFFRWMNTGRNILLISSAICLSIAGLVKLPFILFGIIPVAYLLRSVFIRKHTVLQTTFFVIVFMLAAVPVAAWYLWVIKGWEGNGIVQGILHAGDDQWKEILNDLLGNLVSTLPELLLNYAACLFFVWGLYCIFRQKLYRKKGFYLFAWWGLAVLAYFFFEINMIGTVHDYYMFPFLPVLFVLVAYGANELLKKENRMLRRFAFLLLLILPLTAFMRINTRWNTSSPGFNSDLFKYRQELRNIVPDTSLCVAGNDRSQYIFFYYIHKKGWAFTDDSLKADKLRSMIQQGARYLYSDSRVVNADTAIQQLVTGKIAEKGSISVYQLKPLKAQ